MAASGPILPVDRCVVEDVNSGAGPRDDTHVVWDLEDDPEGNVRHIQEHGISMDEVEDVLLDRDSQTAVSKSSGDPITFGYTASGRDLAVVWEHVLGACPCN